MGSQHTGDLPHKCNICSKGFVRRAQLATHVQVTHEPIVQQQQPEQPDLHNVTVHGLSEMVAAAGEEGMGLLGGDEGPMAGPPSAFVVLEGGIGDIILG